MKTIIQTPTNQLEQSLSFYKKANFKIISESNPTIISEGKAYIEINPDRFARAGIKLYNTNWENTVKSLRELTTVLKIENGYLLSDPSGMWIYLIEGEAPNYILPEPSNSVFGNFAGISLEAIGIQQSIKIFELLGFSKSGGDISQGWISLTNEDNFSVSFMTPNSCPHLFFNPSLTYFNGEKNIEIIKEVRQLNIPITEEITHFNEDGIVDNIIIRDPGGFGFFLFSD